MQARPRPAVQLVTLVWRRASWTCLAWCLLVGVGAAAPAGAAQIGLSDNSPSFMRDPAFTRLGVASVRVIVPWNAVHAEPARAAAWLAAAREAGLEPFVAFERARHSGCPGQPCVLPTVAEYEAAFTAFRAAHPDVRIYTSWNEPMHDTQPTDMSPLRVAAFDGVIAKHCPECTVVSDVLLGVRGLDAWLAEYQRSDRHRPEVWGLHNYGDVNRATTAQTDDFLRRYQGRVWLSETGGVVRFARGSNVVYPHDEQRAAQAIDAVFDLVRDRPRIERAYVYNWFAARPDEHWDSGLMASDGNPRPAYLRLAERLCGGTCLAPLLPPLPPAADQGQIGPDGRLVDGRDAGELQPAPGTTLKTPSRWRRATGRRIRVVVRCAGPSSCAGRVRLLALGRVRTTPFLVGANRSRAVRVAVPWPVWRRALRSGRVTARLQLVGAAGPSARVRLLWR